MSIEIRNEWWGAEADGLAYSTDFGKAYQADISKFLESDEGQKLKGKVDLVLTSPPFPLLAPKEYGNTEGDEYRKWITGLAKPLSELLSPTGSIVMEIGNVWVKGEPSMSTLPLETLIDFAKCGEMSICQQFICHNPARLPSPAQWVTKQRIRLKDSYTHVWWYSKTPYPKADNRKILTPYSKAMEKLLATGKYNPGRRPSEHTVGETSFLKNNGGAIAASMFSLGNTASAKNYRDWCQYQEITAHPARMQASLVEIFINYLTEPGDLVFDPFGGSNTTGFIAEKNKRNWIITEMESKYLLGSIGRFDPQEVKIEWKN